MKTLVAVLFTGCFAVSVAKAGQYDSGMNFLVTHSTTISAIGAYDGGAGFTSTETVGIFNDLTGNLVGSEVVFGPGHPGTQFGDTFYESVPTFVLAPGDYSIIFVGNGVQGGQLSGGNTIGTLGNDLNVPGGERFDSGASFVITLGETYGATSQSAPITLLDPVPDGGMTAMLLGASLAGLGWLRRKI